MENAWLDDPQQAANHMCFGMDLKTRQKARQIKGKTAVQHWVLTRSHTYTGGRVDSPVARDGNLLLRKEDNHPFYTNIR